MRSIIISSFDLLFFYTDIIFERCFPYGGTTGLLGYQSELRIKETNCGERRRDYLVTTNADYLIISLNFSNWHCRHRCRDPEE